MDRPYSGAKLITTINIKNTAPNLEEIILKDNQYLTELIIGTKIELKKIDVRRTKLSNLNLSKTKITLKDYDTLNFPIRVSSGAEIPAREKEESDLDFAIKVYKSGSIIFPFSQFVGDEELITLPANKITFSEP